MTVGRAARIGFGSFLAFAAFKAALDAPAWTDQTAAFVAGQLAAALGLMALGLRTAYVGVFPSREQRAKIWRGAWRAAIALLALWLVIRLVRFFWETPIF